ncbi:hypothetical protein ABIB35_001340 [Arthrobacter sp. UYP6]|uniref:VOC family protein n=1 Tax=Arthrobacter sp. UYP6 TaxID=1756378 RepID=UPI00339B04A0
MSAHELDHVAFAVPSWGPAGEMLHRELGTRFASGFTTSAFNPCQLTLAEDMRLELLEPGRSPDSFVQRFLSGNGGNAAPHHITFKVHNIHAAIEGAQKAGVEPILVNTEHPLWREAFLHPRDTGLGFLAQLVQTPRSPEQLTEESSGLNAACPWEEADTPQAGLPVVFGQVLNLQLAARMLQDVLGAVRIDLPVKSGDPPVSVFRWQAGADLVLQETTSSAGVSGLKALGTVPENHKRAEPEFAGLLKMLASGSFHPELGIRISALHTRLPVTDG